MRHLFTSILLSSNKDSTGIVNTSNYRDQATMTARDLLHNNLNVNDLAPFVFSRPIIIIAIHTWHFLAKSHRYVLLFYIILLHDYLHIRTRLKYIKNIVWLQTKCHIIRFLLKEGIIKQNWRFITRLECMLFSVRRICNLSYCSKRYMQKIKINEIRHLKNICRCTCGWNHRVVNVQFSHMFVI
jgi:hypothetical protein